MNGWQVCDQDGLKGDYISKKTSKGGGDRKKIKGKERRRITVVPTFINSEFNNNPSP